MKLAVIGTGYVGLVAACGFAEMGNDVVGVDIDEEKVRRLRDGELPIYEPGLEELLARGIQQGRLSFSTSLAEAVRASEMIFIAVGTPSNEDGSADLRHVEEVARSIAHAMDGYRVVVVKSTVPIGTCDRVQKILADESDYPADVVSNPEFLKEGAAVDDFMFPDRVVVGTGSPRARQVMEELYEPFLRTGRPVIFTSIRSSEMIKYAANAMLATRISFMNEISNLCERVGADVNDVRKGIGSDPRIGAKFLFPGVGFGGSCFPKDVRALMESARRWGRPMRVLEAVHDVNEAQKEVLVEKILSHFDNRLSGCAIAIWGLAFKPRTDDMREAPSLVIIKRLLERGARLKAFDPVAGHEARKRLGDEVELSDNAYAALQGAEALAIVTEWNEFRNPDYARMKELMARPVIFDGRNIYEPAKMRERGFVYYAMGRG